MKKNFKYEILTSSGFKDFDGIIESKHSENFNLIFDDNTNILVSTEHLFLKDNEYINVSELKIGDIISNKKIVKIHKNVQYNNFFYDPVNVRDVHNYISNGVVNHNCLYVDECAFIKPNTYQAFADAVYPAQDALAEKQTIISSTPNGMNHYFQIVQGARLQKNGFALKEVHWMDVPRWNKNGTLKDPYVFKEEQISKHNILFWNQNFEAEFIGSSATLISSDTLKRLSPMDENEIIFDTLFNGLRIFEEPKKGRYYIINVDPKIDGADFIGIQVIDATELPFRQVASANLQESYMLAPARIFDLGNYYNQGMIIIENNMDKNIADTLFQQYEYDGEIFKENDKNILGFRTTKKTKKIALSYLKKFIEENLLIINDGKTINELYSFVERSNGTFGADEGNHDDLVMSLMILFAPFLNISDWNDFKGFVTYLDKRAKQEEQEEQDFVDFLDLGSWDGANDDINSTGFTPSLWS